MSFIVWLWKVSHLLTLWARVFQFRCCTVEPSGRWEPSSEVGCCAASLKVVTQALVPVAPSTPHFFTMVWAASAALLLTLHRVFSNVMDQDPLKPWAKSNLSSVISIRDCDCSSIQMTNTDVFLEKSFRDHLPLCWGFLFCYRPFVPEALALLYRDRIMKGLDFILFLLNFGTQPSRDMEYFSPTWRRIAVPMTSIWVLGHCGRGSIFRLLDILEFSLGCASSLPTIGSGS